MTRPTVSSAILRTVLANLSWQIIQNLDDNPNHNPGDGDGSRNRNADDPLYRIQLGAKEFNFCIQRANIGFGRQVCNLPL